MYKLQKSFFSASLLTSRVHRHLGGGADHHSGGGSGRGDQRRRWRRAGRRTYHGNRSTYRRGARGRDDGHDGRRDQLDLQGEGGDGVQRVQLRAAALEGDLHHDGHAVQVRLKTQPLVKSDTAEFLGTSHYTPRL